MDAASFLLFAITTGIITYVLICNRKKRQLQVAEKKPPVRNIESPPQVEDTLEVPQELPRQKRTTRRRLEPGKRGGRSRLPIQTSKAQLPQKRESQGIKPEIVCWQREQAWRLGMEIPEEHLEIACLEVFQEDSPLTQDDYQEKCWCLKKVSADVSVRWNGEERVISLGNGNYLLFKINNQDYGRRVKAPSTGSYLMVVPADWIRDEELSGPPPVEPEPVVIHGYLAHYFYLEKGDKNKIAFHIPGEETVVIEPKTSRFELIGNRLEDAREDIGPLFGEQPPQIRTTNNSGWSDVSTIVVGEEGGGKGKWRMAFPPDLGQTTQDLPTEVASRKGGWFFLRFYDQNDELIESLDFRFLNGLKAIKKQQPRPLPSEEGHTPVHVEFLHAPECTVKLVDQCTSIEIQREEGKTTVTIPPNPANDETRWHVEAEGGVRAELNVLVERVWWACGDEGKEPSIWTDKSIILSREDLKPTSHRALWFRFPRRRWAESICVGFREERARKYPVKANERTLSIPLCDFYDSQASNRAEATPLIIQFHPQDTLNIAAPCKLVVKVGCKQCNFSAQCVEKVLDHVASVHVDEFFAPLTYEAMQKLMPSSYPPIYKCAYCHFYVKSDDPNYPTSAICNHIQKDCKKVDRSKGKVKIRYNVITDIDEIKANVIHDLQRLYRCKGKVCQATVRDDKRSRHLIENHKKELYELR